MKKSFNFRQFTLNDLPEILKIEQEVFPQDPWSEKNFRFCYKRYPDGFVVVEFEGKIVGFGVGCISKKMHF